MDNEPMGVQCGYFGGRRHDSESDRRQSQQRQDLVALGKKDVARPRPESKGGLGDQEVEPAALVVERDLRLHPGSRRPPGVSKAEDVTDTEDSAGVVGGLKQPG